MTRIAHCSCGSLRAEVTGEPALLGVCHCTQCQRRTGSAFGVGTYFPKEKVRVEGRSKVYVRGGDSGRKIEQHFCLDCGSTVFRRSEHFPDLIGIAFGAFADPSIPGPRYLCGRQHAPRRKRARRRRGKRRLTGLEDGAPLRRYASGKAGGRQVAEANRLLSSHRACRERRRLQARSAMLGVQLALGVRRMYAACCGARFFQGIIILLVLFSRT